MLCFKVYKLVPCYIKLIWSWTQYTNIGRRGCDRMVVGFTRLCDIVCQWRATGRWFSPGTPDSSINKTDRQDITEILLKVALTTINQTNNYLCNQCLSPLMLRVRISIRARCAWYNIMWLKPYHIMLYQAHLVSDLGQVSVCSPGPPVSSTNKTDATI